MEMTSVAICAGAGGQSLGLERAGLHALACLEANHGPGFSPADLVQ